MNLIKKSSCNISHFLNFPKYSYQPIILCKISATQHQNQQSADEGLMIRSSVPEEPAGETDCSTYVLFQDNK